MRKRTVVVTGAGGIGEAVARRFLERNEQVILVDHPDRKEQLHSLTEKLRKTGAVCVCIPSDVSDWREVQEAVSLVSKHHGAVAVLVNTAGIMPQDPKLLTDMSLEELNALADQLFAVNVKGTLLWSRAVLAGMRERGYGRIVNISSIAGFGGSPGQALYGASKAAIRSITATLAQEALKGMEGAPDIRINAVAPGIIETPMTAHLPEKARGRYLKRNPLRRVGTPDEVAFWVLQLASGENTFMNGQTIVLDGGYLDA